ncbi:hypothetical protein BN135_2421 [Cronobacter muytjensii 530]
MPLICSEAELSSAQTAPAVNKEESTNAINAFFIFTILM